MLLHQKRLYASREDRVMHALFREAGVIVPHASEKVAGIQTCSCCSDGFRIHMSEGALQRCKESGGANMFFHQFRGNGDAMRFALDSPLSVDVSRYKDPDVWGRLKIAELNEVLRWAEEYNVFVEQHRLIHHWPCKAAIVRNIDFAQSINLVIKGKYRIKRQIPLMKVGIDFFCDWDDDYFTTELIKKEPYINLISNDHHFTQTYEDWLVYVERVKTLPMLR